MDQAPARHYTAGRQYATPDVEIEYVRRQWSDTRVLMLTTMVLLSACGGDRTTGPSGSNYAGSWTGLTAQGQPISFTVSAEQRATTVSVGYVFDGCSGVQSFSNLNYALRSSIPASFSHTAMLPDARIVTVRSYFLSEKTAHGVVIFYGSPTCGAAGTSVDFDAERP